jgi:hypothetical protein
VKNKSKFFLKSPCKKNLWSKYDNFKKEYFQNMATLGHVSPKNKILRSLLGEGTFHVKVIRGLDIVFKIGEGQGI